VSLHEGLGYDARSRGKNININHHVESSMAKKDHGLTGDRAGGAKKAAKKTAKKTAKKR